MKRVLAAVCLLGMFATGCAAGSQQSDAASASSSVAAPLVESNDPPVVDQEAVDAVLDDYIAGTLMLTQMRPGSLEDQLAQYEAALSKWAEAADALRDGLPGIPAETSDGVLTALDRIQVSVNSLVACFRSAPTTGCDGETTTAGDDSYALGTKVAALIPYGSRSEDDVLAALEAAGDPPPDAAPAPESVSQANAKEKAVSYLEYAAFSRQGLIEQLEYEGFSTADATYGADAVGADWNEQAALKAQSYLDYSSFSRSGLIEQLEYEGFTTSQANYGVAAAGL